MRTKCRVIDLAERVAVPHPEGPEHIRDVHAIDPGVVEAALHARLHVPKLPSDP